MIRFLDGLMAGWRCPAAAGVSGAAVSTDSTGGGGGDEYARRLASIVESSDDAIIGKDLNGVITSWNGGAERVFGYAAHEAIGQPVTMLIPPGREDEEPTILERIRRGQRIDQYDTVRRHKDGGLLEISLTISPILDAAGRVIGASKIARDVTERRHAEQAAQRLAAIVESSDDAIPDERPGTASSRAGTGAERLFGYTAAEAIGRSVTMLMPADQLDEEVMILARICAGDRIDHYETIHRRRKDGSLIDISLTVSPVKNAAGVVVGAL